MAGTPVPKARLDPSTRRNLILDAAERVIAAGDPLTVSFDDVAAAAHVSRSLVHNYFRDRGGLLVAAVLRVGQRFDEYLAATAEASTLRSNRLEAVVGAAADFARKDPGAALLLLGPSLLHQPELQADRRARADRLAAAIGCIDASPLLADSVLGLVLGVVGAYLPGGDAGPAAPGGVVGALAATLRG